MARIAPVCSSSKGNSVFIGDCSAGILIDAGCSFRSLKTGLESMGIGLEAIRAVLITHEHIDHIRGLKLLTKQLRVPVYGSAGTLDYISRGGFADTAANLREVEQLSDAPTDYEITAFHTPHDCAESMGYTLVGNGIKYGYCTDLGNVTQEVRERLSGSNVLFIESNYEPELLRSNPHYPPYLKSRIASDHGHLSNGASADFISSMVREKTTRVILGHLSQENNTPETAFAGTAGRLALEGMNVDKDYTLSIAPVMTEGKYIAI